MKPKASRFYGSRSIKRRTNADILKLLGHVLEVLGQQERKGSIRHLFYRLASDLQVIDKTEEDYRMLCRDLTRWRRSGQIQWSAFTDNTRWHIRSQVFDDMQSALENTATTYRRNLWNAQPFYIEVWVEKDAIADIVADTATSFGVPVFVCRGFASLSSLYSAGETFKSATRAGKQAIVYHFGDHDPSGVAAGKAIDRTFRDDFGVAVKFVRAAVTRQQIRRLRLPTRPTKTSAHSVNWKGGGSVELDAMRPEDLSELVEQCISQHIDQRQWESEKQIEEAERETLRKIWRKAA